MLLLLLLLLVVDLGGEGEGVGVALVAKEVAGAACGDYIGEVVDTDRRPAVAPVVFEIDAFRDEQSDTGDYLIVVVVRVAGAD